MGRELAAVVSERPSLFRLADLKRRNTSVEIGYTDKTFGEEIVWCGEQDGEYVGWTPKESALARGYKPHRTDENPEVAALIEVAEAAKAVLDDSGAAGPWSDLDAALARFDFGTAE